MKTSFFHTLRQLCIWKTLYFNLHYFGLKNGIRFPVYVAKNMHLQRMDGHVAIRKCKSGVVRLGFAGVGLFHPHADRGVWDNCGTIHFAGNAFIGVGSRINNYGKVCFGEQFCITAGAEIVCQNAIDFGDDVLISWDTLIMDTDFHHIFDEKGEEINAPRPIRIGSHVWIGCRCLLLKGISLPDRSVIAAGSTITHCFSEEGTIIGGLNRVLKSDVRWER